MSRGALVAAGNLLAFAGCCVGADLCTLIACDDGLRVELSALPSIPLTIEVVSDDGQRRTATCEADLPCGAVFENFYPAAVTVNVTGGGTTFSVTAEPDYVTQRPNGRCCPPTCRTALVVVNPP